MVLNSGKTRDLTLAAIAQNIFMEAAGFDIFLKTIHIMGVTNEIADSLSRWQNISGKNFIACYLIMYGCIPPTMLLQLIGVFNLFR